MKDTTDEMRKKQQEIWLAKSEEERFILGANMMDDGKRLLQAGIMDENPGISPLELKLETFRRMYRRDFNEEELENILTAIKKDFLKKEK